MKIGVLTYQNQLNYGAILQAFALQRAISSLGVEVEDINYWCIPNNAELQLLPWNDIRHPWRKVFLKRLLLAACFPVKTWLTFRRRFRTLRFLSRDIRQSRRIYRCADDFVGLDEYDCMIVGSDQVWHFASRSRDVFLMVKLPDRVHRVAYAASLGCEEIPADIFFTYRSALSKYSAISLREPSSIPVVENILSGVGPEVKSAVDPVFLMQNEDWQEVGVGRDHQLKKNFILLYWLGDCADVERAVKAIRARSVDPILLLYDWRLSATNGRFLRTCRFSAFLMNNNVSCRFDAGPQEFISLMGSASYIITNSFHAMAFAHIFKTPMKVVTGKGSKRAKMANRMRDLVDLIGVDSKILYDSIPCDFGPFTAEKPLASPKSQAFDLALSNSRKFLKDALGV